MNTVEKILLSLSRPLWLVFIAATCLVLQILIIPVYLFLYYGEDIDNFTNDHTSGLMEKSKQDARDIVEMYNFARLNGAKFENTNVYKIPEELRSGVSNGESTYTIGLNAVQIYNAINYLETNKEGELVFRNTPTNHKEMEIEIGK